jgi:hypothetical protein
MPDVWDGSAADAMLAAHELRQLDALLRAWIDGARSHEAVDWVDARAEEGHVPVLYHAVRNLAKGGRGGALGGAEFRRAFRLALLLLVRAAQDVLAISVVQGQPPRAATFDLLRDKVFGWLAGQFPVSRWPPLADVLAEVVGWQSAAGRLPLPAWVLSSGPSLLTTYLHVGAHLAFDNPSDKTVAACEKTRVPLDDERARVAATFFAMIGGMSWEGVTAMAVSAFLGATASPACSPKLAAQPAPPIAPLPAAAAAAPLPAAEAAAPLPAAAAAAPLPAAEAAAALPAAEAAAALPVPAAAPPTTHQQGGRNGQRRPRGNDGKPTSPPQAMASPGAPSSMR